MWLGSGSSKLDCSHRSIYLCKVQQVERLECVRGMWVCCDQQRISSQAELLDASLLPITRLRVQQNSGHMKQEEAQSLHQESLEGGLS